jgi:hypothetical protein
LARWLRRDEHREARGRLRKHLTGGVHTAEAQGGTKRGRRVSGQAGPRAIDLEKGRRGWVKREGMVDGLKMKF